MKNQKNKDALTREEAEALAKRRRNLGYLLLVIVNTVILFGLYRVMVDLGYFLIIFPIYAGLCTGVILGYLIYNRGLSRKGLTPDMLPGSWSEEEKHAFLEDGRRRLKKSKWLLTIIVPFLFTFAFEAIDLFVLDYLKPLFSFS